MWVTSALVYYLQARLEFTRVKLQPTEHHTLSLARKYNKVEVLDNDKRSSLPLQKNYYGRKKFYDTAHR